MTIDAWREATKAIMSLALDVVSNKVYGVNLAQGLQNEFVEIGEDKFPMEKDEVTLDWCV